MKRGIWIVEDRELREKLAALARLLKGVIDRRIRAIQHGILLVADQRVDSGA